MSSVSLLRLPNGADQRQDAISRAINQASGLRFAAFFRAADRRLPRAEWPDSTVTGGSERAHSSEGDWLCLISLRFGGFPGARITLAESTRRASEGPFCQERTRAIFHVGKEATVGQLPSCFGQTNPTRRLGYASAKRTRRTMMLSANEANFRKRSQW